MNTATGGMNEAGMFEGGEVTSLREHSWLPFRVTYVCHATCVVSILLLFLYAIR